MDSLSEQIINISKAGAYDIVAKHRDELKQQNDNLKAAINSVLNEIQNTKAGEIIDKPAFILNRISAHCLDALRNNI